MPASTTASGWWSRREFDDAVACLALHYLEDWTAPLAELRRVLIPGGRLVVAVNHPFARKLASRDADYFVLEAV